MTRHRAFALLHLCLVSASLPCQEPITDPFGDLLRMVAKAGPQQGVEVQVLGVDGNPSPDAILAVIVRQTVNGGGLTGEALQRHASNQLMLRAAMMVAAGTRYSLDQDGRGRMPAGEGLLLLAATSTAAVMEEFTPTGEVTPVTLRLRALSRAHVSVTQADGRPAAGVAIGIGPMGSDMSSAIHRTDGDGVARIAYLSTNDRLLTMRVLVPTKVPLEQPFPAASFTRLEFRLPPSGQVRVHVKGKDQASAKVLLTAPGAGPKDVNFLPVSSTAGTAWFPFVEPGVALEARETTLDFWMPVGDVVIGQETVVEIDRDVGSPRLRLLLIDAAGEPLANTRVHLTWLTRSKTANDVANTDANGRLLENVPGRPDALLIEHRNSEPDAPVRGLGREDLADLLPGLNDRGTVWLRPEAVLLRGRIVDAHGRPVPGLVLQTAGVGTPERRSDPSAVDGAFAVLLRPPHPASVAVSVPSPDWFLAAGSASFPPGAIEVEVRVQAAARMLFRIDQLPANTQVKLTLECHGDDRRVAFQTSIDGEARHLRLPPGVWDVVLRFAPEAELTRIRGVVAESGIENHNAQLMHFDWRRFASVATVKVEGLDGRPCDDCTVIHQFDTTSARWTPKEGVVAILVPRDGGMLKVQPRDPKLRDMDLGLVKGERTVRLALRDGF